MEYVKNKEEDMAGTPKPIGRILIIPKGNYDPATPYNSLDLVRYDSKSWLCKTDGIIGITPTEGTDWTLMTEDGTDGTDGRGIVNIQRTGTDPSNPLVDIYTITYTDGTTSTFKVTNGSGGGTTADTMLKSVYDTNGDGIVDNANHAVNADNVGNSDTSLLEKLSDSSGKLNYNGNALMLEAAQFANQAKLGEFEVNQIGNNVKELALHSNITTKLSKLNSDGTLDFSNVGSKPTTLSGYGITDAYTKTEVDNKLDSWHKYNGSIEENTVNTTNTDETITFHSIDTSKAYELWFDTSDGQQATVKSSLISGTDITYTVNTPTAQTKFRLLVKGI